MSALFTITLVLHVVFGVIGVLASYAVVMQLLKRVSCKGTLLVSAYSAALAYFLSWFSGGYYYWFYYGSKVKPVIKEGAYPWAHLVIMEAKEHVFLFLPFATLALALALHDMYPHLESEARLKRAFVSLALVIAIIATIITFSGILISGAAR